MLSPSVFPILLICSPFCSGGTLELRNLLTVSSARTFNNSSERPLYAGERVQGACQRTAKQFASEKRVSEARRLPRVMRKTHSAWVHIARPGRKKPNRVSSVHFAWT